jgi:hypothetical protein
MPEKLQKKKQLWWWKIYTLRRNGRGLVLKAYWH